MKRSTTMIGSSIAAWALGAAAVHAQVIQADTTGTDNFTDAAYYGVQFVSGAGFVQSVTFDLSADADAYFDLDGSFSYGSATAPVLDAGSLIGLAAGDITFVHEPLTSTYLTVQFAPGSFQAGDSFRFAADTDNLVADPAGGGVFGQAGATFSVTLEGGISGLDAFTTVSPTQSVASPQLGGCLTIISQEVVCQAEGGTFTYSAEGVNGCTGGTTQITYTGSAVAPGEQACFTVLVSDDGLCCSTEVCVTVPDCSAPLHGADLDGNGLVGVADLLQLLGTWGACTECDACPADLDVDCDVDVQDMLSLLAGWG